MRRHRTGRTALLLVPLGYALYQVWPWLVQMGGYTRGGWYSYDRMDNAGRRSADRVVPELQNLRVGDALPTSPDGTGFTVRRIDPGRCLVGGGAVLLPQR